MSNTGLDDFLSALIARGEKLKPKRGRPKKQGSSKKDLPPALIPKPTPKGTYRETAVIASYLKRVCTNCNHEEIGTVPRIFLLHQNSRKSDSRIYKRLYHGGELRSWLERLPLRVQLYPSYSPACKHCIQELNENAKSKKGQCTDRSAAGPKPDGEAPPASTGTIHPVAGVYSVQAWRSEPIHSHAD